MNPLQKYFRQPKIYISLPSKGLFYPEGTLQGDSSNVPIFAMTGMDEIIMKTPDALFNGEASVKLIESCCPYIKDATVVPSLDTDTLLVAIRMATFGENMTIVNTCVNCGHEDNFDVNLGTVIENYKDKVFNTRLQLGELTVNIRPLNYQEVTEFNVENFTLQRMLAQLAGVTEDTKQGYIDEIYAKLADIQLKVLLASIESVDTPDGKVFERDHILEWLSHISRDQYKQIKNFLEANKDAWAMPDLQVECSECHHQDKTTITMDQSNFFE
jgi:Zn ribbon nucleic-acid-binding protein